MKIIGVFDSLGYLIFYGGAGGYAPAERKFLRFRDGVLKKVS